MRRNFLFASALCLALAVSVAIFPLSAQDKPDRLSGRVEAVNKDSSSLTVVPRNTANKRTVVYSSTTKVTVKNKPATLDDLKAGQRVVCLGKLDEKGRMDATRIDVRSE